MELEGRLALVTGAGSGIGRAVCQILARDGATIIAADKNVQSAEETVNLLPKSSTQSHLALYISVADSENVKKSLEDIIKKYSKPPSIVINSAGIIKTELITDFAEADFDAVINVNLKGTFIVMQTYAKAMIEHNVQNGNIVNMGSVAGKYAYPKHISYSSSKAAVDIMSKIASKEFGQWNIRVNAVLPGLIETPLSDKLSEETKTIFLGMVPLARMGTPEEVAEVVSFLASDKSSYVNGASIEVGGGY